MLNYYNPIFTQTTFMGNYGFNAPLFVLVRIIFPLALCLIFYRLGHRAGYKKGQRDVYNNRDTNSLG